MQSVDSTNNYARSLIHEGLAHHGLAIYAHEQVQGKGQRGKDWVSEKGENITFSVILNPHPLGISQQFSLNVCVAVAIHKFFSFYAGEDTRIKWPNDLYWQDRKAGGILIENIVGSGGPGTHRWQWAIIGMGININQARFSTELRNPVSLCQITGKKFKPVLLAKELCKYMEENFNQLFSGNFEKMFSTYLSILYKKNEVIKFKKENRVFEATVAGVSATGKLIVKHSIEEEFDFGEIDWLI
ncbi:MAG: biotin--[acetyl-CoA-carboxylase] ligase [Bacteroidetes bacterium]|nr:biotin--[acetyl-CoA-carboxylase] ligase [Bacteroidota bacterium]MBS1632752.1 biotin--[acetyl-CoA-carboxylase] ligase [Bacteroidota bacterium]